jgi:fatty-acyl-CoA synthase/long-chain acyl-CoA synthetase
MAKEIVINEKSTIPQVLKEHINLHPDQLAQIDGEDRMTYREFGEKVDKLASGLLNLGIKPGQKIALVLPSSNDFPIAMYGVIQMGGISVGINPILKPNEFKHIFSDSEAAAVIVGDKFHSVDPVGIIREMQPDLLNLRHVIVAGDAGESEINLYELIEKAKVRDAYHQSSPDELTALIYTSGTTGLPKGSMHSHTTMLYPIRNTTLKPPGLKQIISIIKRYGFGYAWRAIKARGKPLKIYYSMPPYSGAGTMGVIGMFLGGYVMVHMDRFTPTDILKLVEKERISGIGMPPALGLMLVRNPNIDKYDLSSLLYVGLVAAPVPSSLIDEFMERVGCPVLNGFGATELFGGPASLDPFTDSMKSLRETVGKLRPDYEAKIVDENRQPLPTGEVGELAVRGGVRMLGYYKADELTQKTFDDDGWYYTGDQASMDEAGYIRIVGRIKDMIIRGGQNIYPAELENVLITHPGIRMASVVGVPDPIAGEKVLAYVITESTNELKPVDVLNFCRENMAAYKVPSNVYFVDSFPLNATGKVLKRVLREKAVEAV